MEECEFRSKFDGIIFSRTYPIFNCTQLQSQIFYFGLLSHYCRYVRSSFFRNEHALALFRTVKNYRRGRLGAMGGEYDTLTGMFTAVHSLLVTKSSDDAAAGSRGQRTALSVAIRGCRSVLSPPSRAAVSAQNVIHSGCFCFAVAHVSSTLLRFVACYFDSARLPVPSREWVWGRTQ